MGRIRSNQSRAVTEEKLRALVRELLSREQTAFPSERDLVLRTGGARSVIRELLEKMEQKNQLLRSPNGRVINPQANRIPVLFVGQGRHIIDNTAWLRLWQEFVRQTAGTPVNPELSLMGYDHEEVEQSLRDLAETRQNYVIITSTSAPSLTVEKILAGRQIIYVDEAFRNQGKTTIALNNREAGWLAAKELFRKGYRRPALLATLLPHSYLPFEERIAGFADGCRELGLEFDTPRDFYPVVHIRGKYFQNYIEQIGRLARQSRYDSLFLTTDDELRLVLEVLFDQGRPIPGNTGLITVNAQVFSQNHHTRVNTITIANDKIAGLLMKNILAHADGVIPEIPSASISPSILEGETL